jgi:hypothetical protein
MTPRRLLTIPVSHHCEKARWALERATLALRPFRDHRRAAGPS